MMLLVKLKLTFYHKRAESWRSVPLKSQQVLILMLVNAHRKHTNALHRFSSISLQSEEIRTFLLTD